VQLSESISRLAMTYTFSPHPSLPPHTCSCSCLALKAVQSEDARQADKETRAGEVEENISVTSTMAMRGHSHFSSSDISSLSTS